MLRTMNPKDFKNVMFDALSFFFFCLMQNKRVLSSCDVTGLVKNALSLYAPFRSARAFHVLVITVVRAM